MQPTSTCHVVAIFPFLGSQFHSIHGCSHSQCSGRRCQHQGRNCHCNEAKHPLKPRMSRARYQRSTWVTTWGLQAHKIHKSHISHKPHEMPWDAIRCHEMDMRHVDCMASHPGLLATTWYQPNEPWASLSSPLSPQTLQVLFKRADIT